MKMRIFSEKAWQQLTILLLLQATALAPAPVHAQSCMDTNTSPDVCQAVMQSNQVALPPATNGVCAAGQCSDGIRLDHGVANVLFNNPGYVCQFIMSNTSGNDYFVPQGSRAEFLSFLQNPPVGLTLSNCVLPTTYTAAPSVANAEFQIFAEGGNITPVGGADVASISSIAVPTNQSTMKGIEPVPNATTVSVVNQSAMQPLQFFYTRDDCLVDPFISPPPCNKWVVRETQTIQFIAPKSAPVGTNSSWSSAAYPPVITSTYAISSSINGPWTPITVNGIPGGTPGIYNNDYMPPVLQSCMDASGTTYLDGQSWTDTTTSSQSPSSAECPFGAGTRIDNMSTQTNYTCNNGTAAPGTSTTTEAGFTGNCAAAASCGQQTIYVVNTDNNNVDAYDTKGNYLFEFGSSKGNPGSGNGQLNAPNGIRTTQSGQLLVGDSGNARIEVFDAGGNYVTQFGSAGAGLGQFTQPITAAQAPDGNIWVTDKLSGHVTEFSSAYTPLLQTGVLSSPTAVAYDAGGNTWVVNGNAASILKLDSNGNTVFRFGSPGTGKGQFGFMWSMAFDASGRIWVADSGNNRVQVFDSSGNYLFQFGTLGSGNGQFNNPTDIAFDANGNAWVNDRANSRAEEFDSSGHYLFQFGVVGDGAGQFSNSTGIAIGTNGSCASSSSGSSSGSGSGSSPQTIYVVDSDNERVEAFDTTGKYLFKFGSQGNANGQFASTPWAVRIDQRGDLMVTDDANARVQKFDGNGNYLGVWGGFSQPDMAGQAPNGNVWVTDVNGFGTNAGSVTEFNASGTQLFKNGGFNAPAGVAFDSSGNTWITSVLSNTIMKLDSNGNVVSQFGSSGSGNGQFNFPWALAFDSSGRIWVADRDNNRIQVFDSTGNYLFQFGSSGSGNGQFNWPIDLAFDNNGNVWVTDMNNNRVQEFDSTGKYLSQFGTQGSGNGQLHLPIGIAIH